MDREVKRLILAAVGLWLGLLWTAFLCDTGGMHIPRTTWVILAVFFVPMMLVIIHREGDPKDRRRKG